MTHGPSELAGLLAAAEHAIVLSGAGISTESGIPDCTLNLALARFA